MTSRPPAGAPTGPAGPSPEGRDDPDAPGRTPVSQPMTLPMTLPMTPPPVGRVRVGPAVAHYPAGATFGPRTLADFEFVWVLSGSARWTCRGEALDLQPGTLLLVRPGMRDRFAWDAGGPTRHAYVHFDLAPGADGRGVDVSGDAAGPAVAPWPLTRRFADTELLAPLCHYLLRLGTPVDDPTRARLRAVLGWLLTTFVQGPVPGETQQLHSSAYVDALVTHLRARWRDGVTRPVPLAELAGTAALSPGHLARVFRRQFGVGPVRALALIRLARAATLLRRSNLPVAGVAAACGFASPFHFTRRFRQVYGAPPRAYRTAATGGGQAPVDPLQPLARAGLLPLAHRLLEAP